MAADKYGVEIKSIRNWEEKKLPELLKCQTKLSKVLFIMKESRNWWSRKWNSWLDTNQ